MPTNDIILLAYPTLWTFGVLMALWVYVEALNASIANEWRIRLLSEVAALSMIGVAALGALWFGLFHTVAPVVAKGAWPWAAKLASQAREHLIFVPLLLALYLPVVAAKSLSRTPSARAVVMMTAALIVISGLAIEATAKLADFNDAHAPAADQGATK